MMLQAPGSRLTLEANGGGDWSREELLRATQWRPVWRDWFLYDLPGLRLEDFQPDAGAPSHRQVTLRHTCGGMQQLVAKPNLWDALPALEDVVLP